MIYLLSWLREFYPALSDIRALEAVLIELGHDVEAITPVDYPMVTVAEVIAIAAHPHANALKQVTVKTGNEEQTVVCGAPNLALGQKVAFAAPGARLPAGLAIKKTTIRLIESAGMLCAADELGLADDHSGLWLLDAKAKVGAAITAYLPPDATIHLDITADRGDVLSHFGLARDLYARLEGRLLEYSFKSPPSDSVAHDVSIESIHADCPSFALAAATVPAGAQTPLFVQSRLLAIGQRPINPATDLTNYIMLAFGQPLHAYDFSRLPSGEFSVRRAHDGERFQPISQTEIRLTPQNLLVAAGDVPVALAGVIGGEQTKTKAGTTQIVLESAVFDPKAVTISARGLHQLTESAIRFERGVSESTRAAVFAHALAVWKEWTGGRVAKPIAAITAPRSNKPIVFSPTQARAFIGTNLGDDWLRPALESLGCRVKPNDDQWRVTPPPWRFDLALAEDLAEEIVRLAGFNALTKTSLSASGPQWRRSLYWRREHMKDILVALGLSEVQTYPFVTKSDLDDLSTAVSATPSPVPAKPFLRQNLTATVLGAVAANPQPSTIALFEMARVYTAGEPERLAIVVAGNLEEPIDGWWQNTFERFHLPVASWMSRVKTISTAQKKAAKIRRAIVTALEITPDELTSGQMYDILPVLIPDLDTIAFRPLSAFPSAGRDIAIVLDGSYDSNEVVKTIRATDDQIVDVELFDRWVSPTKLGVSKQSLAFHVVYQSKRKTLTGEEVAGLHRRVEENLAAQYHATIR